MAVFAAPFHLTYLPTHSIVVESRGPKQDLGAVEERASVNHTVTIHDVRFVTATTVRRNLQSRRAAQSVQ